MAGQSPGAQHISTLVCRVAGVGIGLDTDQIESMAAPGALGDEDCRLVTIHELFGQDESGALGDIACPKVLLVKGGFLPASVEKGDAADHAGRGTRRIGLVVNEPEEIVDVPVAAMHPMPRLTARDGGNGLWAVALMPDEMILMMDIRKAFERKIPDVRWA